MDHTFEEAQRNLAELVYSQQSDPIYIHSLQIHGLERTNASFVEDIFNLTLSSTSLKSAIDRSRHAVARLESLDLFDDVKVTFDTPSAAQASLPKSSHQPPPPSIHPLDDSQALCIVLKVKEKKRLLARTGTEFGDGEANLYGSMSIRNVFGNAEKLEATLSYGTPMRTSMNVSFDKPFSNRLDSFINLSIFQNVKSLRLTSSHEEMDRGALATYRFNSALGHHEIAYGATWRQILNLSENASYSVRREAGHSLKSSVSHTWIRDRRNDMILPSTGYYLKIKQELSGLGGNVEFHKHEMEAQKAIPIGRWSLLGTLKGGAIYGFNGSRTRINDRFFLGGPTSVRGFSYYGLGPHDQTDAVGGEMYWSAGLSLFTPIPFVKLSSIKGHLFVNTGSLFMHPASSIQREGLAHILRQHPPSTSAGLGLILRHSLIRLELNYVIPVAMTTTDQVGGNKIQLGLGVHFL